MSQKINVIQIGANIGNTETDIVCPKLSPYHKCIFIEPHPVSFEKLKENYKHIPGNYFEQIAIMDFDGICALYYDKTGDLQTASTIENHTPFNKDLVQVPALTLNTLIKKYNLEGIEFTLLQIDAEGMDGRIILNTNFDIVRPQLIRFEYCHIFNELKDVFRHLRKYNYKITKDIYDNGGEDIMWVKEPHLEPHLEPCLEPSHNRLENLYVNPQTMKDILIWSLYQND